jgi:hypothetical protein
LDTAQAKRSLGASGGQDDAGATGALQVVEPGVFEAPWIVVHRVRLQGLLNALAARAVATKAVIGNFGRAAAAGAITIA